jgi:hypothetical protein
MGRGRARVQNVGLSDDAEGVDRAVNRTNRKSSRGRLGISAAFGRPGRVGAGECSHKNSQDVRCERRFLYYFTNLAASLDICTSHCNYLFGVQYKPLGAAIQW